MPSFVRRTSARIYQTLARPTDESFRRAEHFLALGLLLAAIAAHIVVCRKIAPIYEDDAAISLGYARSLARGWGLRLTHYSQVVEGFSNPLWTLLSAAFYLVRWDAMAGSARLGVALGCGSVLLVAALGPAFERRGLQLEDAAAAGALAVNPTFAFWVGSGMETPLQAFLICLSLFFCGSARRTGKTVPLAIALGLLGVTRPEGPLYAIPFALAWLAGVCAKRRTLDRAALRGAVVYLAIVGGYSLFRLMYFAELFPNTYFAKLYGNFGAAAYARSFYDAYTILVIAAVVSLSVALATGRSHAARTRLLSGVLAIGLFFLWKATGDWMHEWRFLAPQIPILCAAAAAGVSAARATGSVSSLPGKRVMRLMAVAGMMGCALSGYYELDRLPRVQGTGDVSAVNNTAVGELIRDKAAGLGMRRALVAVTDLGGIALGAENAEIIDLAGLADYAVAHHHYDNVALADYLIHEGLPSFVSAGWGWTTYVKHMAGVLEHYDAKEFYVLKGLTREEDPRCPGGKAATVAKSAAALEKEIDATTVADPVLALAIWRCAYSYLPAAQLPSLEWRRQMSERSEAMGDAAIEAGEVERAVRYLSLATVLDRGNAWKRRKTETFRARLFGST
jgi:hypothetical protein